MAKECISFKETGYFSELICDYLEQTDSLKAFYNRFPNLDNFDKQIENKANTFSSKSRAVLVNELQEQYSDIDASKSTLLNTKS